MFLIDLFAYVKEAFISLFSVLETFREKVKAKSEKEVSAQSVVLLFLNLMDYPEEAGRFKIVSLKPLHIQFSPIVVDGASEEIIEDSVKRALIYGVYRIFIHTVAGSVTVTVLPKSVIKGRSFDPYRQTHTIERNHAIETSKSLLGQDLSGLVDERRAWSKSFKKGYYTDQGEPGLGRFFCSLVEK